MGLSDLEPDKQRKYDELKKIYQKIPSPKQWGLMISPDRSISSEHFNQN